ncbi:sugar isomerase domain-containing protein [Candidatus Enterococcus ferrettii]|uniref:SIS domain-containing protein n=1 Tax=Candidatus Enterococcus ferrettii TaxID=2815324 RepID=A0ABV0EUC6_9ENTE|nr:SIS domain-containing protein [Enterococcus sp. 665A]MBO1339452.1 SIS domain-containing protein [Enterococcus sp. 665A]
MSLMQDYYQEIQKSMTYVIENEQDRIEKAAAMMSECIQQENKVYFFGTGHSYIVGQEVFARAGGYAGFVPILENELGMNHAFKSTLIERTTEYASVLMELYPFKKDDVIIMSSNSGRNALLIELALRLKELGVRIITITALEASENSTSRHKSGLRLFEVADVVLDNRSVYGDASISHSEIVKTGPTSTIMSCFIVQLLVTAFVQLEIERGVEVPVFRSSNIDGGDEYNEKLFDLYR